MVAKKKAAPRAPWVRLPVGETEKDKLYSMPDPDFGATPFARVRGEVYSRLRDDPSPETVTVNREDLKVAMELAYGYLDLTTYELGQEHCVGKLRDIWRARRKRTQR